MTDEQKVQLEIQAMKKTLADQRNSALDKVVELNMQLALAGARIGELERELQSHKEAAGENSEVETCHPDL